MLEINLKQLEVFVATVEHASFTRAAEALFLSQSTISAHISALEAQLNLRLIQRRARRRPELTAEGQAVYEAARDILERCRRLQDLASGGGSSELKVGASSIPGQYLLPELMSGFLQSNPHSRFLLLRGDSALVHQMLDQERIRLGFVGAAQDRRRYRYHPLVRDRLLLISANTEEFRRAREAGLYGWQLLDRPMILREPSSGTRRAAEAWCKSRRIGPEQLHVVAQIDNPEAVKSSVIQGLGLSIVSELSVRQELADGRLLGFDLDEGGQWRHLYLVHRADLLPEPAEQRFVDHVLRWAKKNH